MRCLLIILFLVIGNTGIAQKDKLLHAINAEQTDLEKLYKHLHRNPELSFQEVNTAKKLATELRTAGFEVTEKVGGHGIVGVYKNGPGPVVMIRTDMDALPLKETTGVEYASTIMATGENGQSVPVMHACGHDLHMTIWTGVARIINKLKSEWRGTLVFIAQPAEEKGAGAKAMLKEGLFTRFPKPDYVLAIHVNAKLPSGTVGYTVGPSLANIDMIDIKVKGKGGHGGMPNFTIDPIVLSARIILALQTIVSREIEPLEPAVITVGSIHGGTVGNIIPAEVMLQLTIRSFNDSIHKKLLDRIKQTTRGIALSAGLEEKDFPEIVIRDENVPAQINDKALTERIAKVFTDRFGADRVLDLAPSMFGEDFAWYGRTDPKIPILMYSVGTVSAKLVEAQKKGISAPSTHSNIYLPDLSPALKTGIESMTLAILELMGNRK